ncbi:embryo-specific protein ATS3B isoform X1 [Amborella trichopoda]|uniref:embryo-specific protein ATS3B isoform X1 n=1 Tax=Amborella trichopoda TaxID=13333 RepID=UPI0005D38F7E|nr:embryo-specific protein ATS3B isoform X1 [Amborella trichopoda]|eukprot:XP_011622482.1 embryo-specific protein ATS3B isoform X1 [Amborella trichopoda]
MERMVFSLILVSMVFSLSNSTAIKPHVVGSLKIKDKQAIEREEVPENTCSYTVKIKTSCSSVSYTRDQISLVFGDAYKNQVYVPRLDDPSSGTFERCSTDTFNLRGPCSYRICYLYLNRYGQDGWRPEWVKIYKPSSDTPVTFYYDEFIPFDVWYGFNLCSSTPHPNNGGALSSSK